MGNWRNVLIQNDHWWYISISISKRLKSKRNQVQNAFCPLNPYVLNLFHLYKTTPIPLSNQYNVQYRPLRRPYCKSYFLWLMVAQAEEVIVSNVLPWDLASFFGWICWSTYDAIFVRRFHVVETNAGYYHKSPTGNFE